LLYKFGVHYTTKCRRSCSVFGEDRGSKLHTVHLAQIMNESTSYCWFLWALLEPSTNSASSCTREKTNCRNICFDYANNLVQYFALLLLLLLLITDSSHSVAAVITPIQTKQLRIYINETIQKHSTKIQNTVNTSTHITKTPIHITKTPPHTLTHTLHNKLKQPQYRIYTK
jgi:hypothetical protein